MNPQYFAAFAFLFLSSACTTTSATRDVMKSWVGVPESQLLASWGSPDRTATLSDGSKVDTWLTDWKNTSGMHTCRKTFTVDPGGKVVHRSWFDCMPDPVHNLDTGLTTARVTDFEEQGFTSIDQGTDLNGSLKLIGDSVDFEPSRPLAGNHYLGVAVAEREWFSRKLFEPAVRNLKAA